MWGTPLACPSLGLPPYLEQWTPFVGASPMGPASLYPGAFNWGVNGAGQDVGALDTGFHWGF